MIIIKHRVNTSKELKKLSNNFGVEIDLRSNNQNIYLHHDPFKNGELFSKIQIEDLKTHTLYFKNNKIVT